MSRPIRAPTAAHSAEAKIDAGGGSGARIVVRDNWPTAYTATTTAPDSTGGEGDSKEPPTGRASLVDFKALTLYVAGAARDIHGLIPIPYLVVLYLVVAVTIGAISYFCVRAPKKPPPSLLRGRDRSTVERDNVSGNGIVANAQEMRVVGNAQVFRRVVGREARDRAQEEIRPPFLQVAAALLDRLDPRQLARIQRIVEDHPGVLEYKDRNGRNLLHYAARRSAPEDVVRYLANKRPQALQERSAKGAVPLLVAAQKGASLKTVASLTQAWRGALLEKNNSGYTALYCAANYAAPFEVVVFLAAAAPTALQEASTRGCLPLHAALSSSVPFLGVNYGVIEFLSTMDRQALQARTSTGLLPFHLAVEKAELDVVQFLLQKYPEALEASAFNGRLAFHYAARSEKLEVVAWLFDRNPAHVRAKTSNGSMPLHFAARRKSVDVVRFLYDRHPQAVRVATTYERWLPLHFAATHGNLATVRLLASAFPAGLQMRDADGRTPLHVAAESSDDDLGRLDVIYYLARMHPEAISGTGGASPIVAPATIRRRLLFELSAIAP